MCHSFVSLNHVQFYFVCLNQVISIGHSNVRNFEKIFGCHFWSLPESGLIPWIEPTDAQIFVLLSDGLPGFSLAVALLNPGRRVRGK